MSIVDELNKSWGWIGLHATEVVGENDFANLMIRDQTGRYWRLCPEELSCDVVAKNRIELEELSRSQAFLHDWYMKSLVEMAHDHLGPVSAGRKYCLKIAGPFGGEYGGANLGTTELVDLIRSSGSLAKQIAGLPDGTQVHLTVTD